MIRRLKKMFDAPKILDRLKVLGGVTTAEKGIRMSDGSPVSVETIMTTFGVSREQAVEIARRPSA